MVNWTNVLSQEVGQCAVKAFVVGELSRDNFLKVFSVGKDREINSQIRNLVRNRGVREARQVARKALRRRDLI